MNAQHRSLGNETVLASRVDILIIGIFNIFNTVLGVVGNLIVLLAVALSKPLQTACNVFIVNLAVADLLTCVVLPVFLLSLWTENQPYIDEACFVALAVAHTTVGCSLYTLASIAVNRFALFIDPVNKKYYRRITKPSVCVFWITLIWIIPAFVSIFPPVALDIGKLSFDKQSHNCRSEASYPTSELYETLLIFAFFPIPLVVLLIAYLGVFVQVLKHIRRMNKYTEDLPMFTTNCAAGTDSRSKSRKPRRKISKLQMDVTRNMFIIFVALIVCVTPHAICNFIQCKIELYTRNVVVFNSMVNPILYGISHPHFRAAYCKILWCKKPVE